MPVRLVPDCETRLSSLERRVFMCNWRCVNKTAFQGTRNMIEYKKSILQCGPCIRIKTREETE